MKRIFIAVLVAFAACTWHHSSAQTVAVKTNLLQWVAATPNVGLEIKTSDHTTLSISSAYNPFTFPSYEDKAGVTVYPKMKHWLVVPEFKYWFCKAFERFNIGIHGIYGQFNMGGIPLNDEFQRFRYEGFGYGGGLSLGYQWAMGQRWGFELSLGAGYMRLQYNKYRCVACGELEGSYARNYVGPTKASLTFLYFFQ